MNFIISTSSAIETLNTSSFSENLSPLLKELLPYQVQIWNTISDTVFFVDTDFCIKFWNRTAEKTFGWKTTEIIGKNIWESVRPDPINFTLRQALKQLFRKSIWQGEAFMYHRNNARLQVHTSIHLILGQDREIFGAVLICQDLTEQKASQLAITRSQEQFKALVQNSTDLITIVKADGTQLYVSPAVETHLKIKPAKGYSKSIFEGVHPEDLAMVLSNFSKVLKEPDIPISINLRYKNGLNEYVFLECTATNRLDDRNIEGVIINARDITESKKAEERLRRSEARFKALVQNSSDVVVVLNANGTRKYVSPSASRVFGRDPDTLLGKSIFEEIHSDNLTYMREQFLKLLQNPGGSVRVQFRFLTSQHEYKDLDCIATNLLDDEDVEGIVINVRDISENIKIEEKIRQSQQKLNTFLTYSPDVVVVVNAEGYRTYVSPSMEKVIGWKPEQVTGTFATEFLHPDDRERATEVFLQSLKDPEKPLILELRFLNPQNEYNWVECVITNRLKDVNVEGVIFNCRDITEKKKSLENIRANEKRFKAMIAESPDTIILLSKDGTCVYVSLSSEKVLGRKPEELLGYYSIKYVHPEDIEASRSFFIQTLKNPDIPRRFEVRFQHSEGHYLWVECTVTNRLQDTDIQGIILNCWNVTERKIAEEKIQKSEQQLQMLMTYSSDFVSVIQEDGTRSYISPSVEKVLGVPAAYLTNVSIYRNMHPEDVEHIKKVLSHAKSHPEDPIHIEARLINPLTQEWIYVETLGNNLFGVPGIDGFMVSTRDITQKRKTEAELKRALEELRKRNYELDNFVYKVSHDLRAPLCSILGLTELIKIEEKNPVIIQEYNKLITNSVNRLDTYIKTVLNYSQVINVEDRIKDIDFEEVVKECLHELRYLPNFPRLKTEVSINSVDNVTFRGDELKITTLFKNFLSNAIKYLNPEASPNWLKISADISEKEVVILITDNGIGIDEVSKTKVFEMFFRGNEKSDGSGLGLYIVKQIIDKLEGTIRLESKKGEGTTFILQLPNSPLIPEGGT